MSLLQSTMMALHFKYTCGAYYFKDTDIRRDILKELVNEARKAGLKIGFYYSQALDWNNPGDGMDSAK